MRFRGKGVTTYLKEVKLESCNRLVVNLCWLRTSPSSIICDLKSLKIIKFSQIFNAKYFVKMSFCGLDYRNFIASDDNIIDINGQDGDGSTSLLGEHGIIILRLCIFLMKKFSGEF